MMSNLTERQLIDIYHATFNKGEYVSKDYKDGYTYVVSLIGVMNRGDYHEFANMVTKAYRCSRLVKGLAFRTWTDDGVIYIEVVNNTHDKEQAMEESRLVGETTIWDCANKRKIKI